MRERHVVIVTFPDLQPLDVVGPHEVFARAPRGAAAQGRPDSYRLTLVSADGEPVRSESGLQICTVPLGNVEGRIDTLLMPGGGGVQAARHDENLLSFIRSASARSRRVATVCSGAFLGAQAGLLDGRRVTTHWSAAEQLSLDYPELNVDPDPIYIQDGKYWSSAGVTAGIDLSLALVQEDMGVEIAQTVARWLVMFLHRPGGQTQFASPVRGCRRQRSARPSGPCRPWSSPLPVVTTASPPWRPPRP